MQYKGIKIRLGIGPTKALIQDPIVQL